MGSTRNGPKPRDPPGYPGAPRDCQSDAAENLQYLKRVEELHSVPFDLRDNRCIKHRRQGGRNREDNNWGNSLLSRQLASKIKAWRPKRISVVQAGVMRQGVNPSVGNRIAGRWDRIFWGQGRPGDCEGRQPFRSPPAGLRKPGGPSQRLHREAAGWTGVLNNSCRAAPQTDQNAFQEKPTPPRAIAKQYFSVQGRSTGKI